MVGRWRSIGAIVIVGLVWVATPIATGPEHGPVGPVGMAPAGGAVTYRPPVLPLRVVRSFVAPRTRYGPGHRGVDLAIGPGGAVAAAGAGVVTFAGPVAGRGVVVIRHADGIRTEYEPVRPSVHRGAAVAAGSSIGSVAGAHVGCASGCLHWGARRGEQYIDPLGLLRPLGPVRLLPWP